MLRIVERAMSWMSTYVSVVISPETTTSPVFTSVSQATRPSGSSRRTASSTPSEIWSAILSGCPSVTDSEVNRYSFSASCVLIGSEDAPERRETGSGKGIGGRLAPFLLATVVVDHERNALEAVALPEAILEEEAVVARQQAAVRHLDREARRAGLELRHVEEPEPLAPDGCRLPRRLDVRYEAVQLRRRYAAVGAVAQVERLRHQALDAAAGLRADRDHLGPEAEPHERLLGGLDEIGPGHVPLVHRDDRRGTGAHRHLRDAQVLARQTLRGVAHEDGDVRALGGALRADLRVVVDRAHHLRAPAHARGVHEHALASLDLEPGVDGVARRAGEVRDDHALLAEQAV